MKPNRRLFVLFLCTIFLLFPACQTEEQPKAKPSQPVPLTVTLDVRPASPKPDQPLHFAVQVKQGETWVRSARVEVEVREVTKGQSKMLPAKMTKPGIYETETTPVAGNYMIIAHVTAAGMHQMDYKELSIESEHPPHLGHDHGQTLIIHIEITKPRKLGEASTLTAHVQNKGTPLSQADVRFEIWLEGEKQHHFISAQEQKSGEYTATYAFPKKGTYQVVLHVEKGKIHDHQKQSFQLP